MALETTFNAISVVAIVISVLALAERWRGGQRARQEANILTLSNQINDIYGLMDENLMYAVRDCDKSKVKRSENRRDRMLIIQKLHIHLDAVEMMIKMESMKLTSKLFGREHSQYYKELVGWYCSVHALYNRILDTLDVDGCRVLHIGTKDKHKSEPGQKLPAFLRDHKYAHEVCELFEREACH